MPSPVSWPRALVRDAVGRLRTSAAPPAPADWLVCCVAENDARFLGRALRFVQSVRWLGGASAGVRVRVGVVDAVQSGARARLEALGAEVRVVPRLLARNPFANKLQAFLDQDWDEAALYFLCDCDTLIVQDPLPFVRGDAFQAKIADLATVSHAVFADVFRHFGLRLPHRRHRTDFDATPTIPYFNSGVVVLPRAVGARVVPAWREVNRHLVQDVDLLGPYAVHANQASLAVALALLREPVRLLDLAMNFPTHLQEHVPPPGLATCDPAIVHYHDCVDRNGSVIEPPYPAAAARVRVFNDLARGTDRSALPHAHEAVVTA